jgi:hypothetical protein
VRHQLPRGTARICEPEPEHHIVEARLEKLQQCFAGDTATLQRSFENPAKLFFQQAVLITELLFFTERDRVIGLFAARPFGPCMPGG